MKKLFKDKKIIVLGGTGFVGKALVRELLKYDPKVIRILSRDDSKQFMMRHEFDDDSRLRWLIGDIRDKERLFAAFEEIDIVFNAAAIKHVPASEYNPYEAVKTNVLGVQNIVEAAIECGVDRVINMSTDKATAPSNVMGATKLLGEKLLAASSNRGGRETKFASVRFGNVLGSRGSVVPLFIQQIKKGGPVTVTDENMQRYVVTVEQAIDLVLRAVLIMQGGEVFLFKMPVIKLTDLAQIMIEKLSRDKIEIKIIGLRHGETLDEDLLTTEESMRALETDEMFIILPTTEINKKIYKHEGTKPVEVGYRYSSADQELLPYNEIKEMVEQVLRSI